MRDEKGLKKFEELSSSGILWLINRVVFHPRGFALAITVDDDKKAIGWEIKGNGKEIWTMDPTKEDEKFAAAEMTLAEARENEKA